MTQYPIEIEDSDTTTNMPVEVAITPEIRALAHRPYAVVVVTYEDDSGWVGRVPDLRSLVVAGDTPDEMMHLLDGAKEAYIAAILRRGESVPEPRPYESVANPRTAIAAR
jgi:predicted RNase H-like HicB family nuclease